MIVTRVQIKTATKQKHLYCLVFTKRNNSLPLKAVVFSLRFYLHFFSLISNFRSRRNVSVHIESALTKATHP